MTLGSRSGEPGRGDTPRPAPPWRIARWFNADPPLTLQALRGRVVVLGAFQLLCPGCVSHGVPQLSRAAATFDPSDVAVIGLHTVFEHHAAQGPETLAAFLHENRVTFPVGVDAPAGDGPPRTFTAYGMNGTPSLILIDRSGRLRAHTFGRVDDLALGASVARLAAEPDGSNESHELDKVAPDDDTGSCEDGTCAL